jgi:hypothetical protein
MGDNIYRGIITGYNKAFVIDQITRDRLIAEDPKSTEVIKPWLRGRDVERWQVEWGGEYVITIQNSDDEDVDNPWGDSKSKEVARAVFEDTYPAIHDYLSRYEKDLIKRWDQGKFWWELRACAYYKSFAKPKIVYQEIATFQAFAFVEEPFLMNNKCFFIPTEDHFLLGIFNSKVTWFFLSHTVSKLRGGAYAMQTPYVKQIPIPEPTPAQREAIEALVGKLLAAEGQGPRVPAWERALNEIVYEVYGLTAEEVALVEPPNEFGG